MTNQQDALQIAIHFIEKLPSFDNDLYYVGQRNYTLKTCYKNLTLKTMSNLEIDELVCQLLDHPDFSKAEFTYERIHTILKLLMSKLTEKNRKD
jgi:hypothetical protein